MFLHNLRKRFESSPVWNYVNGINIRPMDDRRFVFAPLKFFEQLPEGVSSWNILQQPGWSSRVLEMSQKVGRC